ncbi:hypothetical protein HPB50_014592 [Hyalomma asiaticum]|uniref:Uncharacterized protein n=1 Tax=Hyalomma asiaticum TaxID=266040 RepID=A0ACB7T229_HYAAI|nr:hypothetical protein HPB50_014592 [Hyalomma asiaticum]
MTATHLESAALLLETQIAVDDPSNDLPEHAEARQMAARPYDFADVGVPFTEPERAVLLNLLGAFKTTRTTALQVLMRAPPITLELERANVEFELLIARKPIRDGELSVRPDRVLPTLHAWQEHPAARCAFRFLRLARDEARRMARLPGYTDGSYTDRLAGAAFIVLGPSERIGAVGRYQVENATSAYCTEIIAVIEALRYVKNRCSAATVRFYTDCLSLLQAISEYRTPDPRVRDVKALLKDISVTMQITLYHVPGHSGLFGNELADFLAAHAARLGDARQALLTPRAVRSMLRTEQLRRWESEWRQNNADTDLFKWVPLVSEAPPWFPPNHALVTLLTGHGRFHSYFHRFNLLAEPVCSCGATCEGTDHHLYDCPLTTQITTKIEPRVDCDQRRGNEVWIGAVVRVSEDLHVPTCTFCATYGHGKTACPHKTNPTKCVCMKCGENHIAESSAVRMGDAAVFYAEYRRAGRPAEGHPTGFPGCPLLMEKVARLKARTNYGPCH